MAVMITICLLDYETSFSGKNNMLFNGILAQTNECKHVLNTFSHARDFKVPTHGD